MDTDPHALEQRSVGGHEIAHSLALGHVGKIQHHPGGLIFQCEGFWTIGAAEFEDDLFAVGRKNGVLDLLQLWGVLGPDKADHSQGEQQRSGEQEGDVFFHLSYSVMRCQEGVVRLTDTAALQKSRRSVGFVADSTAPAHGLERGAISRSHRLSFDFNMFYRIVLSFSSLFHLFHRFA